MKFENERLLVIAPHPDDETLGCYSLMQQVNATGGSVFIQVMTVGGYHRSDDEFVDASQWKKEFQLACKANSVTSYDIMLDELQFRSLDELRISELIKYIEHQSPLSLKAVQPTIVAIPTLFSTHQDHCLSYKAAITALRTNPVRGMTPPRLILSYEAPEYNLWSPYVEMGNFAPNFFIAMSGEQLEAKCSTLELYRSQIKEGKRGIKSVQVQAAMRGYQAGYDFAEAFNIQRSLLDNPG